MNTQTYADKSLAEMTERFVVKAAWAANEAQQQLNTSFGGATACFTGTELTEDMETLIKKAEGFIETRKRQIAAAELELEIMRKIVESGQNIEARNNQAARWNAQKGA